LTVDNRRCERQHRARPPGHGTAGLRCVRDRARVRRFRRHRPGGGRGQAQRLTLHDVRALLLGTAEIVAVA